MALTLSDLTLATATTTSSTLATLNVTINPQIQSIMLIPADTSYFALGTASASTPPIPSNGVEIAIDATHAALLQLFGSSVGVTVMQFISSRPANLG
jgi:hypothetical protein